MPRSPRTLVDGFPYHVTARGNNRNVIFRDKQDYTTYLAVLTEIKRVLDFTLYAYCLMPNHIHLLLSCSPSSALPCVMHRLNLRYAKYFNKRYDRIGHALQNRYFSRLIADDNYLVAASRYVHRNPVEASLCSKPEQYRWSSYRAYLDSKHRAKGLVDVSLVLGVFGCNEDTNRRAYDALVRLPPTATATPGTPQPSRYQVPSWGTVPGTGSLREKLAARPANGAE